METITFTERELDLIHEVLYQYNIDLKLTFNDLPPDLLKEAIKKNDLIENNIFPKIEK